EQGDPVPALECVAHLVRPGEAGAAEDQDAQRLSRPRGRGGGAGGGGRGAAGQADGGGQAAQFEDVAAGGAHAGFSLGWWLPGATVGCGRRRAWARPSHSASNSQAAASGAASMASPVMPAPSAVSSALVQMPIWSPPRYTKVSMTFLALYLSSRGSGTNRSEEHTSELQSRE